MTPLHTAITSARQAVRVSQAVGTPGWRVSWRLPGSGPVSARTSGRKAAESYARTVRVYIALRLMGYSMSEIHAARRTVTEAPGAPTSLPGMVKACLAVIDREQGC